MTKKEYFNQLCKECKKGDTCTKRAFHYPEENACPKVLGVASQAWDAAVEATIEKACEWLISDVGLPFMYEGNEKIDRDFVRLFKNAMEDTMNK